jgi:hypothetical protein
MNWVIRAGTFIRIRVIHGVIRAGTFIRIRDSRINWVIRAGTFIRIRVSVELFAIWSNKTKISASLEL